MSFSFVTNQTILARNAGALYGVTLSNSTMTSLVTQAGASNMDALLNTIYKNSAGSTAPAIVAAALVSNFGLTGDAATQAQSYIVGVLTGTAVDARGAAVNNIITLFSSLATSTEYPGANAAATAFNAKVANSEAYSSTSTNTSNASFSTLSSTAAGSAFTLTTGVDTITVNT